MLIWVHIHTSHTHISTYTHMHTHINHSLTNCRNDVCADLSAPVITSPHLLASTCVYACVYVCVCARACVYVYIVCMRVCTCARECVYTHVCAWLLQKQATTIWHQTKKDRRWNDFPEKKHNLWKQHTTAIAWKLILVVAVVCAKKKASTIESGALTHTHTHIYTYTHARAHAHIHTHTCTHVLASAARWWQVLTNLRIHHSDN